MWVTEVFGTNRSEADQGSNYMKHIISIIAIVVMAFSLISNTSLIYILYKDCRPLSITKKLFIYLSIVDLLAALVMETGKVYVVYAPQHTTCPFMNKLFAFGNFLTAYSIIIFGTISILRFLSIKKPLFQITNRLVYAILLVEVLLSISIGGTIGNPSVLEMDEHDLKFVQIFASSSILFIVIVVFAMNLMSYVALGKQFNRGTVVSSGINTKYSEIGENNRSAMGITIRLFTLHSLMLTNSSLNSIIYMCRMKKIGRYIKCFCST